MADKQKAFLLFSIGPVQEFIATARRTHDLWAGSRLLSLLMVSALEVAKGAKPIFPLPNNDGEWPKSVPNRAVLEVSSTDEGVKIGREMVTAVQKQWTKIESDVRQRFTRYAPPPHNWVTLWNEQNANWFEHYWVTWPQNGSYSAGYSSASEMLTTRKMVRPIVARVEEGEKCTLSGVMAALPGAVVDRQGMQDFWDGVRANLQEAKDASDSAIRRGEQLCALSVVKRFAEADTVLQDKERQRFPSTSSVAAADFRLAVLKKWGVLQGTVQAWMTAVSELELPVYKTKEPVLCLDKEATSEKMRHFLKHDGDYLYLDFYTEPRILEALGQDKRDRLTNEQKKAMKKAANTLNDFHNACWEHEIMPPSPYYALLKMDGDNMGATLSEKIEDIGQHRKFSRRLAAFAQDDVPRIVEQEAPGALVYAGGDDALALLPVSVALSVAEKLRSTFAEKLSDETANGWEALHASTGLVFVHHQAPLQTAVRQATIMEKTAKHSYGRNAIAIRLLRRSGEPHEMGSKWEVGSHRPPVIDHPLSVITVADEIRQKMVDGVVAMKFAYEVLDEAEALSTLPPSALEIEIGRLLYRHWDEGSRKANSALIQQITTWLVAIGTAQGIVDLARWLILMAFLAKRGGEA